MKKRYTIDDINQFFEQFKQLPEYYELEKVHFLINNPGAIAKPKGKTNFYNLKFIIVTSTFITSVFILFFWLASNKYKTPVPNNTVIFQKPETDSKILAERQATKSILPSGQKKQNNISKQYTEGAVKFVSSSDTTRTIPSEKKRDLPLTFGRNADCSWPANTVIDKHSLFVYLTNDELLKLGVFLYKNSLYYNNKSKGGAAVHLINSKLNAEKVTTYNFNLVYVSDTACTTYRWGHKFYNRIDVLVPVIVKVSNNLKILWFSSNSSFFSALPERYRYLESVYQNLKCLKRRNPGHRIVNYCDPGKNIVLDSINYLRFSREELQKVGVGIFKDSIILIDSTQSFRYRIYRNGVFFGTNRKKGNIIPETPSMFPVMITDVKGLNQASFGSWAKKQRQSNNQYSSEVFNTLIPVNLPVSDFMVKRKYSLILWYYPSEAFLKAMPMRYRKDIKSEIDYIHSGEKSGQTTCTYFEACKSTLALEDLKIFPNPTSLEATIEFTLFADVTGKISLVNIAGSELRLLVPQTQFLAGFNSFKLNLGNVTPGIYLVSIITDKGFKTQRIIISR